MKIRLAREDDAEAISELLTESGREYFQDFSAKGLARYIEDFSPAKVRERLRSPEYRYYLAMAGNELAGFCAIRGENHLYNLFTAKAFQRKGIARKLWGRALDDIRKSGTTEVTVNASSHAVPAYERLGFVRTSETRDVDGIVFNPMIFQMARR
ncbi:MAG: GNAT family N-acetyltransferase [Gammaproteobacteria bacterium]|jgi:ribosomal protein S18 acetylase RimI-like enzyme